ncbi:MAG: hypothetical protein ACOC4B_02690 [Bacteroidota bacterium]
MQKLIIDINYPENIEALKNAIALLKGVNQVYTEKEFENLEDIALASAIDEGRKTDFVDENEITDFLNED